jgi:hypothetical protein
MLSFSRWCPHMKLTKMILQLTLRSTKGHLGYKLCKDIRYNVGIQGFPTVHHMIKKPYMQAAWPYVNIITEVYTEFYYLEIWIFSRNTTSVNSLTNFICTHMCDGHWPTSWCVLADYIKYRFVKNPERAAHQAKAGCTWRCLSPIEYY